MCVFDAALPAAIAEQTLQLDPVVGLPGAPGENPAGNGTPQKAVVQITPRDPQEDGYTAASGTLTVSSASGVAPKGVDRPRLVRLFLTDRGWALRQVIDREREGLSRRALASLDHGDRAALVRILDQVRRNLA